MKRKLIKRDNKNKKSESNYPRAAYAIIIGKPIFFSPIIRLVYDKSFYHKCAIKVAYEKVNDRQKCDKERERENSAWCDSCVCF